MSAQNIIEFGFNIEELTAEKKQVLDLFVDLFGQLKQYDGTRFNPLGDGGLADLKKSITEGGQALAAYTQTAQKYNETITQQAAAQQNNKKGTDELAQAMQQYQRIVDQLGATQAKNNAATSDAAEGLAVEKQALKDRNAELSASARLQQANAGSLAEAKAQVSALQLEQSKLNLTTEEGRTKNAELNAEIDKQNEFIKENVSAQEQQRINIGNYAGSLQTAFGSVKEQLETVNKQLAEMEVRGKTAFTNAGQAIGFSNDRFKGGSNISGQTGAGVTNLAGASGDQASILNQDSVAYQKLTLEQKILEQSLQRQTIGFKSANQEMRNVKNTLDALALAGLEDTETFEKLNIAYTQNEQKVKDLHREQAILTTDAPALTALTGVARGLGGAYALGAGAAQLFATGNEKLDKELNKLVAVMTLLQGLESALSALRERNAIVTALEAEGTKALNYVKQIGIALFGEENAVKIANTAITTENTEALAANAEGTVINTEALVATTAATEGAEAATVSFRSALISTGVGAILVAAGIAAAFLIAKIVELAGADEKAIKLQGELADATQKLNETISKEIELLGRSNIDQINGLKDQVALMEAAGLNKEKEFATKTKIAELDKDQADKAIASATQIAMVEQDGIESINFQIEKKREIASINDKVKRGELDIMTAQDMIAKISVKNDDNRVTAENVLAKSRDYHLQQYQIALVKLQDLQEAQANDITAKKPVPQSLTDHIEAIQKVVSFQKDAADKADALIKLGETATSAVETQKTEITKFNEDERRKVVLETANIEADYIKSKNELILSDDRSTLQQRLAAIRSNAQQEKDLSEAQKNNVLSNSGSSTADKSLAIQKAAEEEKKITADSQEKQYKLTIEYADRELAAKNAIQKNALESDAASEEAITKNAQKELEARLSALNKNIDDKVQIIEADYQKELTLAKEHGKTDAEIAELTSNRQKALVELTADTQKQIYDITISYGEARLKAIEEQNKAINGGNSVTENYNAQADALDKALINQTISYSSYVHQKQKLDESYRIQKDQADIADDQAAVQRLKDFEDKELQLKIAAANAQLTNAKAGGDTNAIANAQSQVDALKAIQNKADADEAAAKQKLEQAKQHLNQDTVAKTVSAGQFLNNKLNELAKASFDFASQLVDASYEKRIRNIELETERQDAASEATISAVQRSTLSQREQAEEVTILAQQQRARDSAAKKEERQEKVAEARFDRDVSVAKAIWAGAEAEISAIGTYGGTPYGFAIAAVIAALTAVQVATILAKPIPTYAEGIGIPGRGEHPGGTAVVGEDGPELVKIPGRKPFVVDEATMLDLAPHSIVQPLNHNVIAELGGVSMERAYAMTGWTADRSIEIAINSQTSQIVRALKKSQKQTVTVISKINIDPFANPNDSITRKLRGTRK